jgi:hypothetical protein
LGQLVSVLLGPACHAYPLSQTQAQNNNHSLEPN